jgi:hypothetical protein
MSQLKSKFDSASLKVKFSELLESIDRNNTSKMIVERYYGKLASLEIAEGTITAKDAYTELLGKGVEQNQARHLATASTLSEAKTTIADSYLLGRVAILESAIKELKAYSWMPQVKTFITEGEDFIKSNQTYILIESVIRDLEVDRNKSYYTKAITALREASNSENPVFAVVDTMESEVWIPLVKRLYEYCNTQKGAINGQNPNFKVSKIYSPVEAIDENTFAFASSGKFLVVSEGGAITESTNPASDDFTSLVRLAESAKFANNTMRVYPNPNSVLDIAFGEETKVSLNGKLVESSNITSQLMASGIVRMNEQEKLAMIGRAINEGSKIKEIDFGYKVTSSIFEGLSATIFNTNDRIFIQKVNKGMQENSIVEAANATEAVDIVKTFMNYDISESLNHLLENEKAEVERKTAELNKVESRVKFIIEKLADIEAAEKTLGKSEFIDQAKSLLESQLKEQNDALSKLKGEIVEAAADTFDPATAELPTSGDTKLTSCKDLVAGQEYTVKGTTGYVFQGEADGSYMFNQKDLETSAQPIHIKESEVEELISAGEITQ